MHEIKEKGGSVGVVKFHSFEESLKKSHSAEDLPFWNEIYKKAFPTLIAIINHRKDGDHQRLGIDRSIVLENSKQILVDEKTRFKNEKTGKIYNDIALEYWSDIDRQIPGWVCKPLLADYIAYAIAPLGKCYLLPVIQLQEAWKRNHIEWIKNGFIINAKNKNGNFYWTTVSVGVDPKILFAAIGKNLRIDFTPCDF